MSYTKTWISPAHTYTGYIQIGVTPKPKLPPSCYWTEMDPKEVIITPLAQKTKNIRAVTWKNCLFFSLVTKYKIFNIPRIKVKYQINLITLHFLAIILKVDHRSLTETSEEDIKALIVL